MTLRLLAVTIVLGGQALNAQGRVTGYALESSSGRPLGCLRATWIDSSSSVVATVTTRRDGSFEFLPERAGLFRVRFSASGFDDMEAGERRFEPGSDLEIVYRLALHRGEATAEQLAAAPGDTVPTALGTSMSGMPGFPSRLRKRGVTTGSALFAVVVDERGRPEVASAIPLSSTDTVFSRMGLVLLERTRFRAAQRDGAPVCALTEFTSQFSTHSIPVKSLP